MGRSRVQRGKRKLAVAKEVAIRSAVPPQPSDNKFWPIPELTRADMVFGEANHLPPYHVIPDQFRRHSDPYVDFVSSWFFGGRTPADMQRLKERPGVDRNKALTAIKAALGSFAPKHEHKEAGCAFLLHEWFELEGARHD